MKVLFLDIDGVVNYQGTRARHGSFVGIDPPMAAKVKKIIKDTGCSVVLSSTWRLGASSRAEVRKKVCDFIDVTGRSNDGFRGGEVNEWLGRHPEVEVYAILDDDSDFFPGQHLFKTSWQTGITEEVMNAVIEHLNAEAV